MHDCAHALIPHSPLTPCTTTPKGCYIQLIADGHYHLTPDFTVYASAAFEQSGHVALAEYLAQFLPGQRAPIVNHPLAQAAGYLMANLFPRNGTQCRGFAGGMPHGAVRCTRNTRMGEPLCHACARMWGFWCDCLAGAESVCTTALQAWTTFKSRHCQHCAHSYFRMKMRTPADLAAYLAQRVCAVILSADITVQNGVWNVFAHFAPGNDGLTAGNGETLDSATMRRQNNPFPPAIRNAPAALRQLIEQVQPYLTAQNPCVKVELKEEGAMDVTVVQPNQAAVNAMRAGVSTRSATKVTAAQAAWAAVANIALLEDEEILAQLNLMNPDAEI